MNEITPLYIQIKNDITNQIFTGKLNPGDKIPSVREYAIENKMNINTISNAFTKLDNEGLTIIKRGQGRFVTEDKQIIKQMYDEKIDKSLDEFVEDMNLMGLDIKTIVKKLEERI